MAPPQTDVSQQRFDLSERVRKQEIFGFLEIGNDVLQAVPGEQAATLLASRRGRDSLDRTQTLPDGHVLRYQSNSPTYDEFFRWAEQILNRAIWQSRCQAAGITQTQLASIVQNVPLVVKGLAYRNKSTGVIEEGKDENGIASILIPGGLMALCSC